MCALVCVLAAPARAQSPPQPAPVTPAPTSAPTPAPTPSPDAQEGLFSPEARRTYYEQSKLSTSRALAYSALPGLGHYYADDPFTGTVWIAAFGFGVMILSYGLATDQSTETWIGAGLIGGAYAGALITAPWSVEAYNRDLRVQYGLERQGVRLRLGWSWSF